MILFILLALMEEIIFRGILYRITEQYLGTWMALIICALLFGIFHITNEHADFLGIVSTASGGIMLGVLNTAGGRLWLPLPVHTGWNFFQYFFGLPVSGMDDFQYFMNASREGPDWFVGGGFGTENSLVTILLVLGISGLLLYRIRTMGMIIKPGWKKYSSFIDSGHSIHFNLKTKVKVPRGNDGPGRTVITEDFRIYFVYFPP